MSDNPAYDNDRLVGSSANGEDGLDAYREILGQAREYLADGGVLVVEIGFDQHQSVSELGRENGWKIVQSAQDLGGQDRALRFG